MAQYPETESIGSIGSIVLAVLEVQVVTASRALGRLQTSNGLEGIFRRLGQPNRKAAKAKAQKGLPCELGLKLLHIFVDIYIYSTYSPFIKDPM